MAQKVVLIDDIDGTEGVETIRYTVDGQEYEIDLSEKNADKFRTILAPFIEKSRTVAASPPPFVPATPTTRRTRRSTAATGRTDIAQIRAWAESKGIEVAPRGRIKQEIYDQYDAERNSGGKPFTPNPSVMTPLATEESESA
jgi:hypothetical protein